MKLNLKVLTMKSLKYILYSVFLLLVLSSCNKFSNYIPNEIENVEVELVNNRNNSNKIIYPKLSQEMAKVLLRDLKSAVPVLIPKESALIEGYYRIILKTKTGSRILTVDTATGFFDEESGTFFKSPDVVFFIEQIFIQYLLEKIIQVD